MRRALIPTVSAMWPAVREGGPVRTASGAGGVPPPRWGNGGAPAVVPWSGAVPGVSGPYGLVRPGSWPGPARLMGRAGRKAPPSRPSVCRPQQTPSPGFGFPRPKSGRSLSPAQVPRRAEAPQIQPCRLPEAMPAR